MDMDTENNDVVDAHRETSFMQVFPCTQKTMMKLWLDNGYECVT